MTLTRSQISLLKTKRGQAVGFKSPSGLVRFLGYVNMLSKEMQKKIKSGKKK